MRRFLTVILCMCLFAAVDVFSQQRTVLIPGPVGETPYKVDDQEDLFGKAYRWFLEGAVVEGQEQLRLIINKAGVTLDPNAYYIVVAHFSDTFAPMGLIHDAEEDHEFLNTRMYGLTENNLYYIFITRNESSDSYISALITEKASPSQENLAAFLSLFIPIIPPANLPEGIEGRDTWVDVRQFTLPEAYRKNSDISIVVKKKIEEEEFLARQVFDNTSRERWSYGIATAITSINDVDIIVGNDGTIIVRPKPQLDLAAFAVVNYHFKPVDTKSKKFETSFHLMTGIRLIDFIEPIVGAGFAFDLGFFDLAIFGGVSVEFANELKDGFQIGDAIDEEVDPFKLKLRPKPRFGLQVKFP